MECAHQGQCLQLHSPHATHQVSWCSSPHLASGTANLMGPAEALRRSHTMSRPSPAVVSSWLSFTCEMPARGVVEQGQPAGEARLENVTRRNDHQKEAHDIQRTPARPAQTAPWLQPLHLTRDAALLRKLQGGAAGLLPHVEPGRRRTWQGMVAARWCNPGTLVSLLVKLQHVGKLHQRWCQAHSA